MTSLATPRLMLTPATTDESSIRKQVMWLNDHDIMRYSEQRHKWHTKRTQIAYINSFSVGENTGVFSEINFNHRLIGTITARIDKHNSVADVGILIGERDSWNKGLGAEAWTAFCDHLLSNGIRKIEAGAMSCNIGMVRIFIKSGMHLEGKRSGHFLIGDELIDMVLYGRFL